ncbi:MAG: tetratricopeptide repeat protein [Nitrospirae bacterium]|nr:tetratricopeptide repeat protein [Nitrospirota bacterium]
MKPLSGRAGRLPARLFVSILGPFFWAQIFLSAAFSDEPAFSPEHDDDWKTIQATVQRHQYSLAIRQLGSYVRTHPRNRDAYLLGGRLARKIHTPNPGIALLDRGVDRFPGDPVLLRLKAELYLEKGDMVRSKAILSDLSRRKDLSRDERAKVREDRKALRELAMSMPPLVTFDQNINFQEAIPPPFQSPGTYALENASTHLRVSNTDLSYSGGSSIGTSVAVETPLIKDTVHFQAGDNLYVGTATGQSSAVESYLFAGVDGQGPDGIQFLADAGDVFAGGEVNAGFYGHVDVPAGPIRIDGQVWYQLPWSGYGQAIIAGGLQSGGLLNATWTLTPDLSLTGEYEYTSDTIGGTRTPFGANHNTLFTVDWRFRKSPDLHLVAGYDSQTFTPFVPNPVPTVPVLLSSRYGFAGLSSLDQIGRYVVLNGQIGGVIGTFDTPGPLAGFQGDGGLSVQVTPRIEFYANLSYETLAAAYVGSVTTLMSGINFWF